MALLPLPQVISKDSIQMQQMQRLASDPQSLRVSLENLDTVVKSVLAPFLCSIMEKVTASPTLFDTLVCIADVRH